MKNLSKYDKVTGDIITLKEEIVLTKEKISEIEIKALNTLVSKCKNGFNFHNIEEKRVDHNTISNYYPEIYCFDTKGVFITSFEIYSESSNYGGLDEKIELWLSEDLIFKFIKYKNDYSLWDGAESIKTRDFVDNEYDLSDFNIDDIFKGIYSALNKNLSSLSKEKKDLEDRLSKLNAILEIFSDK